MQERRQNVRVRPTGDYNIGIDFGEGVVKVRVAVADAAVIQKMLIYGAVMIAVVSVAAIVLAHFL